jgi:hypothetical protein
VAGIMLTGSPKVGAIGTADIIGNTIQHLDGAAAIYVRPHETQRIRILDNNIADVKSTYSIAVDPVDQVDNQSWAPNIEITGNHLNNCSSIYLSHVNMAQVERNSIDWDQVGNRNLTNENTKQVIVNNNGTPSSETHIEEGANTIHDRVVSIKPPL